MLRIKSINFAYIFHSSCIIILKEKAQALPVPPGRVKRFRCAFFNFSGGTDQAGGWSYRGVKTEIINNTHIRCNASHLTTFVVLVSIIPAVRDPVSGNVPFVQIERHATTMLFLLV